MMTSVGINVHEWAQLVPSVCASQYPCISSATLHLLRRRAPMQLIYIFACRAADLFGTAIDYPWPATDIYA